MVERSALQSCKSLIDDRLKGQALGQLLLEVPHPERILVFGRGHGACCRVLLYHPASAGSRLDFIDFLVFI